MGYTSEMYQDEACILVGLDPKGMLLVCKKSERDLSGEEQAKFIW